MVRPVTQLGRKVTSVLSRPGSPRSPVSLHPTAHPSTQTRLDVESGRTSVVTRVFGAGVRGTSRSGPVRGYPRGRVNGFSSRVPTPYHRLPAPPTSSSLPAPSLSLPALPHPTSLPTVSEDPTLRPSVRPPRRPLPRRAGCVNPGSGSRWESPGNHPGRDREGDPQRDPGGVGSGTYRKV